MKYFDSYRIFHGKDSLKEFGALTAAAIAVLTVMGVFVFVSEDDVFRGFVTGLVPFVCGAVIMGIAFGLVCGVSNGNLSTTPGYKFFHSLADGAEHYRRALLFSNMLSLVPTALYAAVGGMLFRHYIIVVMTLTVLLMTGFLNLTSHMRSPWLRIGGFCVIGFAYGFYGGATNKAWDDIPVLSVNITVIVCALTLAFYIVSVIIALERAETLWNKEV